MESGNLLAKLLPPTKTYLSCVDYQSALRKAVAMAQEATHKQYLVAVEGTTYPALEEEELLYLPYNDITALETACQEYKGQIAAFLLEPVPTSQGLLLPKYGYLEEVSRIADAENVWLLFDETTTLFPTAIGGCQSLYEVEPHLTCYRNLLFSNKDLLPHSAPLPAALFPDDLLTPEQHYDMESLTAILTGGLTKLAKKEQLPLQTQRLGRLYSIFMTEEPFQSYTENGNCDLDLYTRFCQEMLDQDIQLPPSQFTTNILPPTATAESIEEFLQKAALACANCK